MKLDDLLINVDVEKLMEVKGDDIDFRAGCINMVGPCNSVACDSSACVSLLCTTEACIQIGCVSNQHTPPPTPTPPPMPTSTPTPIWTTQMY
jgi:hypothetical protein